MRLNSCVWLLKVQTSIAVGICIRCSHPQNCRLSFHIWYRLMIGPICTRDPFSAEIPSQLKIRLNGLLYFIICPSHRMHFTAYTDIARCHGMNKYFSDQNRHLHQITITSENEKNRMLNTTVHVSDINVIQSGMIYNNSPIAELHVSMLTHSKKGKNYDSGEVRGCWY